MFFYNNKDDKGLENKVNIALCGTKDNDSSKASLIQHQ